MKFTNFLTSCTLLFFIAASDANAIKIGNFKTDDIKIGGKNSIFEKPLGTGPGSVSRAVKDFEKGVSDAILVFNQKLSEELEKVHSDADLNIRQFNESVNNININISADMSQADLDAAFSFPVHDMHMTLSPGKKIQEMSIAHGKLMSSIRQEAKRAGIHSTDGVNKLLADANQIRTELSKALMDTFETNKQILNRELTKIKADLDRELAKAKTDVDRELTKAKSDTDDTLENAWDDIVTEWNYFGATFCGEPSEVKAIWREYNQREISETERKRQLKTIGADPDKKCAIAAQADSNGKVTLLDKNGKPSETPSENISTVGDDRDIVVWNAKVELHDFLNEANNSLGNSDSFSVWKLAGMERGVFFGYFNREPAGSFIETVPSSRSVPFTSASTQEHFVGTNGPKFLKVLKWAADRVNEYNQNEKLAQDIERARQTLGEEKVGSYVVLYNGNDYYGISKMSEDIGSKLQQGSASDSSPYALGLNLRQAEPSDSIPFYKMTIYPVVDLYKEMTPTISNEEIIDRVKTIFDAIPAEQHEKTWEQLEKEIHDSLKGDTEAKRIGAPELG